MMRWIAGLAAVLILPACGGHSGSDGRESVGAPTDPGTGQLPSVRIVSPESGASVSEGSTITIRAEVTDPGAAVARVEFYDENQLIGSASSPPYTLSYGRLKAGSHRLCAVAVDGDGNTMASAPVTLFVVQGDGGDHDDGRRGHDRDH